MSKHRVIFIAHDGTEHAVEAEAGQSLLQCAQENLVPGILGDCGGCCSCATCHVHVDPSYMDKLPAMTDDENDLLDSSDHRNEYSRLSCQVPVTEALEGIKVTIAQED